MSTSALRHWAVGPLVFLTACYTQRPLLAPLPVPGTRIIAQLTDSGVVAMANAIGSGATEVEGVVVAADGDAWSLNLVRVDHRGGTSVTWNGELVRFPRFTLTHVAEKRLDKRRSWFAAGLVTAGVFLAARLFGAFSGGGNGDGPEPPPPN